jgi:hypothetical protein
MTFNDPDDIIQGLHARRAALLDELWTVAAEVAAGAAPEVLTRLVRLKADIEAIDFAVANAPQPEPDEDAKVVSIRS